MGAAKQQLMRLNDLRGIADAVCRQAKALRACRYHDDVSIDQGDGDANRLAYALGTNMVKRGEVDATREEFMEAITAAIEKSADTCPDCARYFGRD